MPVVRDGRTFTLLEGGGILIEQEGLFFLPVVLAPNGLYMSKGMWVQWVSFCKESGRTPTSLPRFSLLPNAEQRFYLELYQELVGQEGEEESKYEA